MDPAIFDKPFFEVTLPLMVTFLAGTWAMATTNNRRIDDLRSDMNRQFDNMNRRFDDVNRRLDRIETRLDSLEVRVAALEERTSPLRR